MLVAHEAVYSLVQRHEHVLALHSGHLAHLSYRLELGAYDLFDVFFYLFRSFVKVGKRKQRAAKAVGVPVEGHCGAARAEHRIAHLVDGLVQLYDVLSVFFLQLVELPEVFEHGLEFRRGDLGGKRSCGGPSAQVGDACDRL